MKVKYINKYIYIIGIFLIVILTFINYQYKIKNIRNNKPDKLYNEFRLASIKKSDMVVGNSCSQVIFINIKTNEKILLDHTSTIIILLSQNACIKCLIREFNLIKSLKNDFGRKLSIYGIVKENEKKYLSFLQENFKEFKFYVISNGDFNKMSFSSEYPQILYLKNKIISLAHLPIINDNAFSQGFYSNLSKVIKNSL